MKSILLFIPVLLLLVPVNADAYKMEFLPYKLTEQPYICVWSSDIDEHVKTAILVWHDTLVERFGSGYALKADMIYDHDEKILSDCNIHIIYVPESVTEGMDKGEMIGGYWKSKYGNTPIYLFIYEERENRSFNSYTKTVMHEMGHAFGMNHVIPESAGEGIKPWPNALMWAWNEGEFGLEIDEETLKAFKCHYIGDSWSEAKRNSCGTYHPDYYP